ncbi:S-adenosylmethionine-dependent methyltransferase [Martiniozyma asiatica (nom. inval.)]|nr:S-adenosylmethionine-dependent methyltransferase [Martiniozyma asiatica]
MDRPDDVQEYSALTSVLSSHTNYYVTAYKKIFNPKRLKYNSLFQSDKDLLPWFPDYLEQIKHSIEINQNYFGTLALKMAPLWGASMESTWASATVNNIDKMNGLMAQYVREWSDIGQVERDQSMGRILKAAELLFPNIEERFEMEVLVPGSGLGRLVYEFVRRGFKTQGNEISYHMLLNSNYILNFNFCCNQWMICPFLNKSSHLSKRTDQLRQVYFPDIMPSDLTEIIQNNPILNEKGLNVDDLMSIVAGGFEDLYGPPNLPKITETYSDNPESGNFRLQNKGRFKIVATCFFLDTANNIIDYIRTIDNCLSEDGYWINFGPLLWHFEDDDNIYLMKQFKYNQGKEEEEEINIPMPMQGLELSREDLFTLIENMGFEFIERESDIETSYGSNDVALGGWKYKAEFWICRKKKSTVKE